MAKRRRLDRYDFIALAIVALLVALWVAHFLMPESGPPAPV
jgi:hypothetical protein